MRIVACLLLLPLSCTAFADTLPSFLNSNDTIRNLPVPNLPADAYRPTAAPLQVPEPGAAQAQPLMMGTKVNLKTVQIEGGTIYPLSELAAIYQPLLGHESSLADLIEATRNITRRYQQDGYLLSYAFLPQQTFDNGVARVVLVEGYIRNYQLQGDVGRVKGLLDKLVAKLQAERPLTRKTFERYTTLMSRIPGVTLQAQVPPPGTTDGATDLIAQASRKPFTSSLSTTDDNRNGTQALLGVSSNSQTAMGEQLSLSGLFPPGDDDEHYYRLDYNQFLNAEGTQLALSASRYRADPGTNVQLDNGLELKPHRENDRYSIGFNHPVIGLAQRTAQRRRALIRRQRQDPLQSGGLPAERRRTHRHPRPGVRKRLAQSRCATTAHPQWRAVSGPRQHGRRNQQQRSGPGLLPAAFVGGAKR